MSRLICFLALVFAGQTITQSAVAEAADYVSLGAAYVKLDDDKSDESDMGILTLTFGHQYQEHFTFETRLGTSLTDYDREPYVNADGALNVALKLDYLAGVYLKVSPFDKAAFSPYLTAGYTWIQNSLSHPLGRIRERKDSPSFGVGLDFCGERYCANLDLTRYINDHNYIMDAASLNFAYRY